MLMNRIEQGQGLVEYALIILLIALIVIAVVGLLGTQLSVVFQQVADSFP
jgi:pilus assembly protein Flp/PilA